MTAESVDGEVAIVTGGSGGIGMAVAAGLLDRGARVAIVGRSQERLQRAAGRLDADAEHLLATTADVADADAVSRLVDRVHHRFGRIDVLVHLAAQPRHVGRTTWEIEPHEWQRAMRINLDGAFHTTRAVLEPMLDQAHGTILHVSDTAMERPFPGAGPYGAAKAGVRHLIETLAQELDGTGVNVNGVNPGPADTSTLREVRDALTPARRHWPGRLAARDPSEAALIILWLCSPAARHLSGEFLSWRDLLLSRALSASSRRSVVDAQPFW
jgi:NAD(P)-dependent dehydrogenase (short-subunit alcohol dehydrogenase family)